MLVLVLCHFHSSVVNSLVVKLEISESRAQMPVVVWRCRSSFRNTLILAVACRLSLGKTIRFRRTTASSYSTARQLWRSDCLVRPSISICLVTALQLRTVQYQSP